MQDLSTANPWLSNARLLVVSEPSGLPEQYSFMNRTSTFSLTHSISYISGLPDTAMWVLVSLIHWETAGHTVVNLRMVLDACSKASMYQDSIRFVVSNAGEARSVTTTAIAPALLQTVRDMTTEHVNRLKCPLGLRRLDFHSRPPTLCLVERCEQSTLRVCQVQAHGRSGDVEAGS